MKQSLASPFRRRLDAFRGRLAHAEALPQLAILAIFCGVATSLVAIGFRLAIEIPLSLGLPGGDSEGFENLSPTQRFALPIVGALALSLIYRLFRESDHRLGVSYVIERYQLHQGQFPPRNMLLQFFGGAIALISGHSGGREGPAVHLGAAGSSLLGQWLKLPNNSLRVLTGCGIAAAIAASFNTPLAGVIFAMEVVMMEYTVTGFIPVIIAAVTGSIVCHLTFGNNPAFFIPDLGRLNLQELPWLVLCSVAIGLVASILLYTNRLLLKLRRFPFWWRFIGVGVLTGITGLFVPAVLGMGYDTVQQALSGELGTSILLTILCVKLMLFSVTFALGVPIGGIGPMFVLGACLGGAFGVIGHHFAPEEASTPGFYALLGMGGMMAAALNAPLAALVAILELTRNPDTLMPSMLVIVGASLTARTVTGLPGLFLIGYDPKQLATPVMQMLNRFAVTSAMNTNLYRHSHRISWHKALQCLESKPDWIIIEDIDAPRVLLPPADLARYLHEQDTALWDKETVLDLLSIPASRRQLLPVHPGATLQEAWVVMKKENITAVYITRPSAPLMSDVAGILTRRDIEAFYQL